MKTFLNLLTLAVMTSLIPSCNNTKTPSGIYRTSDAKPYELDFQSGGTGHLKLAGMDEGFKWRAEESGDIIIEIQGKEGKGARLKWEGSDLIMLGPNWRFSSKSTP